MAFKIYNTIADYNADPLPLEESRVSLIRKDNYGVTIDEIKYDSVGRTTEQPLVGDVCCLDDDNNIKFLVGGNSLTGSLPLGWELVGYVFNRSGNNVKILHKTWNGQKWLGCWQYAITAIASTTIQIGLRMSNDYAVFTNVDVTLTSATINQTSANEISAAVAAKATAVGDIGAWWAWYDSDNDRIIVQVDTCSDYRQYTVRGTNCTISLCVWEDIPASPVVLRKTLAVSDGGILNVDRSSIYFGTNGVTPASDVDLKDINFVKKTSFENSSYCAALRVEYGTYENYISANKIKYPQKYGAFNLPDSKYITQHYGNATAPTKSGGTINKFPALHSCATVSYNADGLRAGSWYLSDITDGIEYLNDSVLAIISAAQRKMGTTQMHNSEYLWFGRRGNEYGAYSVHGQTGTLSGLRYITNSFTARAVCTLDLTQINQSNNS